MNKLYNLENRKSNQKITIKLENNGIKMEEKLKHQKVENGRENMRTECIVKIESRWRKKIEAKTQ